MPELPEVETVRSFLLNNILDKKINSCKFTSSRVIDSSNLSISLVKYQKKIIDQKIINIFRLGKYLIFEFSQSSLLAHLGMSGRILLSQKRGKTRGVNSDIVSSVIINPITTREIFSAEISKRHLVWEMYIGDKKIIKFSFYDPRTFGKVIPLSDKNYQAHPKYKKLGLDALLASHDDIAKLWPLALSKKKTTKNIKNFLLDQSNIAGLGNIYTDEILFEAKIRPLRIITMIKFSEWKKIIFTMKKILKQAIVNQGTSFGKSKTDYRLPDHSFGKHQQVLKVYGKKGRACVICGKKLSCEKLSNRTTVYCINCQK